MAVFGIASENVNDEISNFQMGRYVSTNEALWRLLSFQIHERYPTVVHLAVHLENGQRVYFTEANAAQRAERPPSTTLTSFFAMCEADPFAATLMYVEMPKYYTWNQSTKKFQRRKQGTPVPDWPQVFSTDALGRMYTVHPRNDECFYLRLLLVNVRGPKSFAHLKTVNGHQCQTYREACQLMGLLENDSHWDLTLADSVVSSNAYQIRTLFAIIITTCFPSQPIQLWNKYKDAICEDILHRLRIQTNNPDIQITDEIYNEGLILIEDQCLTIANKLLIEVGMIAPNRSMHDAFNQELNRELQYNVDTLQEFVRNNVPLLNEQQKQVYETLMQAVDNNTGGLFFLDAPGGTGKTFVISLILATIRSRCDIALALASSGIAATLLDGGRTAHSALKLPLNLNTIDTPTCNISRSSAMGKLLMQCKLIVWDECTMAHKKSLEALNFTLKDLRRNNNIFGGLMILLAGDFRQTLPVVPRGTPADELNACLKASPLWNNVKTLSLTTNMRVQLQNDQSAAQFSKQLLDLGNGKVPVDATSGLITLTNDFCRFVDTQLVLIENVFPNISENYKNYAWLSQRAILAAKNNDVHALNFTIQSKIAGDLVTYKSVDSITNPDDVVNYPTEFLNSLEIPGFPPHNLQLKVGTVIMILRNLNPPRLCNGTRLSVKRLMPNLIEATIINGKKLVNVIYKSKCFSVLADETTDISTKEQLSICVRYIDENNKLHENFLQFFEIDSLTGNDLANSILNGLNRYGFDCNYLYDQGYDGASNMAGRFKRVQTIVRSKYPNAIYVHCAAHSLNLAVSTASGIKPIRYCLEVIEKGVLINTIENSNNAPQVKQLKRLCPTRWIQRYDSVNDFSELFSFVLNALDIISDWKESTYAEMLQRALKDSEFLISLNVIKVLFSYGLPLCKQLQTVQIDLKKTIRIVENVIATLKCNRDNNEVEFKIIYNNVKKMADDVGIELLEKRISSKQTHRANPNSQNYSTEQYYRVTVFLPYIDHFISQLTERFINHKSIFEGIN
ncbi:hypothetical protein QTP88_000679 [Uroleucon formosanum]